MHVDAAGGPQTFDMATPKGRQEKRERERGDTPAAKRTEAPEAEPREKRRGPEHASTPQQPAARQKTAAEDDGSRATAVGQAIADAAAPTEQQMVMVLCALTEETTPEDEEHDLLEGLSWHEQELDQEQVREGRREERRRLKHFEVYEEIPEDTFDGEVVDTKWVQTPKEDFVRCRIVGKQYANERVEDFFAGTPDAVCFKFFLATLAARPGHAAVVSDAVSAFLQAAAPEGLAVRPPMSERKPGIIWLLKKALPGMRSSSRQWQDHQAREFTEAGGFTRHPLEPCVYMLPERGLWLENHGDDTLCVGPRAEVIWFSKWMPTRFECNVGPVISRTSGDAHAGKFLRRPFWVNADGWHYEADPRHAEKLLRTGGLEEAKSAVTPGSREVGRGDREDFLKQLGAKEHREYRQQAGLLQYLAGDRYDLKFAAKELMRECSAPTVGSQARLKRALRYLCGAPRAIYTYGFDDWTRDGQGREITIDVDSDYAGCTETRRSTSSLVARVGPWVLAEQSVTQPVVALPSSEAEFHAIVRGIAYGI